MVARKWHGTHKIFLSKKVHTLRDAELIHALSRRIIKDLVHCHKICASCNKHVLLDTWLLTMMVCWPWNGEVARYTGANSTKASTKAALTRWTSEPFYWKTSRRTLKNGSLKFTYWKYSPSDDWNKRPFFVFKITFRFYSVFRRLLDELQSLCGIDQFHREWKSKQNLRQSEGW